MPQSSQTPLSQSEKAALRLLANPATMGKTGGMLLSDVEAPKENNFLREPVPGLRVFQKLASRGLATITEEPPIDPSQPDLGSWTPSIELTPEGVRVCEVELDIVCQGISRPSP